MRRLLYAASALATIVCLAVVSSSTASIPLTAELDDVVFNLPVGASEDEVREAMERFTLDSGKLHWGGTGSSRLYLQLAGDRQLWIALGGFDEDFKVLGVGRIEAKQPWRWLDAESITVEEPTYYP